MYRSSTSKLQGNIRTARDQVYVKQRVDMNLLL